ncbi:hypothetical protein AJ78_03786 [Emergomyces pasteurianus Ep9510]|uniref:Uncharacterized protein n=1 Tax=Emergomyces pasteurianus Ep9510 TaxID=1447872 RepID=A0A1J9PHW9_9EURO|nr:hypothetical protein AJ78_03786 [Emergomyces pasteurianus Ep9510]
MISQHQDFPPEVFVSDQPPTPLSKGVEVGLLKERNQITAGSLAQNAASTENSLGTIPLLDAKVYSFARQVSWMNLKCSRCNTTCTHSSYLVIGRCPSLRISPIPSAISTIPHPVKILLDIDLSVMAVMALKFLDLPQDILGAKS